jgi:hypothetical protein
MNYKKVYVSNVMCEFCETEKIEGMLGNWYCPNSHNLVTPSNEVMEKQPLSIGNIVGKNIYRKTDSNGLTKGKFCNSEGLSK